MNDIHIAVHDVLHWLNEHGWRLFCAAFVCCLAINGFGIPSRCSCKRDRF